MTFMNEQIAEPKSTTDEKFYTTDAFTDYGIRFIKEHLSDRDETLPFFLYLAYTAPHWPLQAFEDDIAKYRGKYKIGWDELRKRRLEKQVELGLIDPKWQLSPRTPKIPAWDTLDDKKKDEMDLKMAVYAAMIDRVDQNIGKLVMFLKENDAYEDTLIFFLSDNGGCQEGGMFGRGNFHDIEKRNQESGNSYGEAWSNASNTPFRLYKHFAHEGGSATPFFMHWPAKIKRQDGWYSDPAQLIDVVPTILDVAGAKYPEKFHGNDIPALDGISLRPAFNGKSLKREDPIFIEHENNAFIRDGDWKLVGRSVATNKGTDASKWELYNMAKDRTETNNLVSTNPAKAKELAAKWEAWAKRAAVYPKQKAGSKAAPSGEGEEEAVAPVINGRPLAITAEVRQKNPKGVVLAQGGLRFGWSLHFVDGKPAFSVRNEGKLTTLVAGEPVSGKATLTATLDEKKMSISVDGKEVASRKSPGLIVEQPGLGFFVGLDGIDPVADYKVPHRFNGKILSHSVNAPAPKVTMRTPWAAKVDPSNVWTEYPRPQLRRENWTILNGHWDYAVTSKDGWDPPKKWDGKILVPFAIEAPLSGVEKQFTPDDALWYRLKFETTTTTGKNSLLHFEAVDYASTVWVNGKKAGSNVGGNLPFSFDITELVEDGENTIIVRVTDATDSAYQLHGKQRLTPKGIWYTPVSGIWQTVWMEEVPSTHVLDLRIDPKNDGTVTVKVNYGGDVGVLPATTVTASLDGKEVASATGNPRGVTLKVPDPKLWSPDSPTLYDLKVTFGNDTVDSYFGFRELGKVKDADGHWRLTLNGDILFHWGTLDQGWWPDGLLTPPSDEAMVSDVQFLKDAGFNTIRKHIKVEPRRYYYHCDKIGMMVWQDQVSAKRRDDPEWTRLKPNPEKGTWPKGAHEQFMAELKQMMDTLHNHPSIVQWVPFNERWGQHNTVKVGKWTVKHDPTRAVNIASGGNFFPVGDIVDAHKYPHPGFPFDEDGGRFDGFIKIMGEFGGHGFPVDGHLWSKQTRNWGYGGLPKDKAEWLERYETSIRMLAELRDQGIAGGIYTQTTDVEGEINGLITYDRKVKKIPAAKLKETSKQLFE